MTVGGARSIMVVLGHWSDGLLKSIRVGVATRKQCAKRRDDRLEAEAKGDAREYDVRTLLGSKRYLEEMRELDRASEDVKMPLIRGRESLDVLTGVVGGHLV
ncbi:unnamed protein product [Dovyalis caffra]|uniref:Uncharacterized protein n=1 Tax=Dovyalis caffra TaxID=77055 RepID=A0AAV1SUN2_9ROSI|nr:unnamed protein product [Dovyalis caffra]